MGLKSIFWKVVTGKNPENGWTDSMHVDHFEPYTPGQLTKNFTATVADEISVTRGTTVKALYRDEQWIYVQVADGRRGFVPQTYCKLLVHNESTPSQRSTSKPSQQTTKKKTTSTGITTLERKWEKSNLQRFIDSLPVQKDEGEPFKIDEICTATVIHSFDAISTDDINANEGEVITVLNCSDTDWTYIRKSDKSCGFVPSVCLKLPQQIVEDRDVVRDKWENENLLVVEPFTGRSSLDLTVRPGEWIKCTAKPVDDWLWAQRMSDEKQGFIPNKIVILATDL